MNESEVLERLWRKLSPAARKLLSLSSEELTLRNEETRKFVESAGWPHPMRWNYARAHAPERRNEPPLLKGVTLADAEVVRGLGFFPASVSLERSGSTEVKSERWIAPDGAIHLEAPAESGLPSFLACYFDDNRKLVVGPKDEVWARMRALQPDHTLLDAHGDLLQDYALLLNAVAERTEETGAAPLYKHRDSDLDWAVQRHYDRHMISLHYLSFQHAHGMVTWSIDKASKLDVDWEGVSTKFVDAVEPKLRHWGRRLERDIEVRARVEADALLFQCRACTKRTRVPFGKLGAVGKCGHCKSELPTAAYPLDVESTVGLDRLIADSPIPILVDVWASWCGPCLAAMPALIEAAEQAGGSMAIVRLNAERFESFVELKRVQALPTMIRFVDGRESGRSIGAKPLAKILEFGRQGKA